MGSMPISRLCRPDADANRQQQPDDHADADQAGAAAGDQAEDVALRRADREADADLTAAHADQIRQHAVTADAGQRQRQHAEHHEQVAGQLLLECRGLGVIGEAADVVERHLRIELAHGALQLAAPSHRGRPPF